MEVRLRGAATGGIQECLIYWPRHWAEGCFHWHVRCRDGALAFMKRRT